MKKIIFFTFVFIIYHLSFNIYNCSAQWTYQGTVVGLSSWPQISVYGPNELVTAGGPTGISKVFKSTNGGVNWTDISGNLSGPELTCVWAINGDVIFVGDGGSVGGNGGNAKIWKTTNGGMNWTMILSTGGSAGFFNGIVFSRTYPLIGVIQSDPPIPYGMHYLSKTTDGGNTWYTQNTISTNGTAVNNTVICIDNLFYGWGVYPPARVVITSDGGSTWNQMSLNLPFSWYTSGFAFSSDKNIGVAVSDYTMPYISRSVDGGNTWTPLNTGLPITSLEWGRVKWVYGTNTVFLSAETGASGCIGKSTNAGLNWSVMNTAGITNLFNIDLVYIGGIVYVYAIARDGRVIKLQEPVGIVTVNNNVPSEYNLSQNYPNPFNPITKIRFDLPKSSFVRLAVYDALGRELEILVNEMLNAGTYEVDWAGDKFSSGIYYYKLTSGDFRETKKMIFNK